MGDMASKIDWQYILDDLAEHVPAVQYDAWIRPIQAVCKDNCVTISAPSRFFLDGFKDRYESLIRKSLHEKFGSDIELKFAVDSSLNTLIRDDDRTNRHPKRNQIDGYIDPRFTFSNFVVGSSNEFCYAACRAVAEQPGEIYNPLYIHGGVGLGKTHLITAVANAVIQNSNIKIAYRTSESFTNELISAIRNGTTQQFRNRYRKVDILFIDDVQFIAGKGSTQEEFFHTFNALYEVRKQIVLTSDRSPRELDHLEDRLKSRFNWGLVADIQPPDYETRLAILCRKAELAGVTLPENVGALLAHRISNNVRELEGALTRLTAHATLTGKVIDIDFAKHVLRDLLHEESRVVSVEEIQKRTANYYNIRLIDMRSKKRTRNIALPRQIAMYACKQLTTMSYPEIGEQFGGRDHTTVLHAVKKISDMMKNSKEFQEEIHRLLSVIKG
jgi:chromosomal replication initiator protein